LTQRDLSKGILGGGHEISRGGVRVGVLVVGIVVVIEVLGSKMF